MRHSSLVDVLHWYARNNIKFIYFLCGFHFISLNSNFNVLMINEAVDNFK